jgi:hypothetical protein
MANGVILRQASLREVDAAEVETPVESGADLHASGPPEPNT